MSDGNPIVLRRMLALRQFPLLAGVDLRELATFAENVVEETLRPGAVISVAGARVAGVRFVLDGRIESATTAWGPRDAFGALEVLAYRASGATATAVVETRTLELPSADFAEVIEDNFGVLQSVLRYVASRVVASRILPVRAETRIGRIGALGLVERLIVLRHQLAFANAPLRALSRLAHASDELRLPPGTFVTRAGDVASRAFVIVEGTLRGQHEDGVASIHGAGDAIGLLETVAMTRHELTVRTVTPVRALTSTGAALFDVLEDHTEVGLAMLATFARTLTDPPNAADAILDDAPTIR